MLQGQRSTPNPQLRLGRRAGQKQLKKETHISRKLMAG